MTTDTQTLPFFEVPSRGTPAGRRLLLVSCVFPPHPGVGALRWRKMSRFAAARGWGLDVVTFGPTDSPLSDEAGLGELPPGTRVFAAPSPTLRWHSLQLAAWRRLRRFIEAGGPSTNGSVTSLPGAPDYRARERLALASPLEHFRRKYRTRVDFLMTDRFARQAARIGLEIVRAPLHRAVISSGPPHMAHEAARLIAESAAIPFVMDMRDSWCEPEVAPAFVDQSEWLRRARQYEARCVESARLVVANTEPATEALRHRYPRLAERFITVMNGADDDPLPRPARDARFLIAFTGTLYMGRDPRGLFAAVGRVVRELRLSPADLAVVLMGSVENNEPPPSVLAADAGITEYFTYEPERPRAEALALLARASLLVNLPQSANLGVPAKIFEYVRFEAWLLTLAARGTATERFLRGTGADVVEPDDVSAIADVVRRRYEAYRRGERPRALNADGRFDRGRQAELLFDALDQRL